MPALEFNFGDIAARPGWRLHRLEMLNWGTFGGGRVHVLEPAGSWSLLVGESGSGKSTAIDALRTLLVPRNMLRHSFNDAAGGQGKRDRSLVSYIRGQWSSSREDDAVDSAPTFLRQEDTPTIILAVFSNERRGTKISVAQRLVVTNSKDQATFLVAPEEKSIAADLQGLGSGREMARQLKERRFSIYDGYTGYFRDFGQRMDLPDQSAMEIFNHAIGIKEVVSVNDVLRRHLLTSGDALDRIRDKVIPSFANLEQCWESIQRDKDQIALLTPIVEAHEKVEQAQSRKAEIEHLMERLPVHYGRLYTELLLHEHEQLEREVQQHQGDLAATDTQISGKEKSRDEIKAALARDESTLRIKTLEFEMRETEASVRERRKRHQDCETVAKRCSLGEFHDADTFRALKTKAAAHHDRLIMEKDAADQRSHNAAIIAKEFERRLVTANRDLQTLRDRRVLIPHDFQLIRDMVCEHTGLSAEDLPFAGELIEVKPEREEWAGAIERLMHAFGVSLLVPEHCYQRVAPLINRRRLMDASGRKGLRFLFHRVPTSSLRPQPLDREPETVAHCLNYRGEHPLAQWTQAEVQRSFHHVCCRDTQELEGNPFGLTREGLVRSGTRHVKDDRQLIDDRTQYVLGWSPQRKIEALEKAIDGLTLQIAEARAEETRAREEARLLHADVALLNGLLEIASFAEIDFGAAAEDLERLRKEKADLEASSEARKQLTEHLARVERQLTVLRTNRDSLLGFKQTAIDALKTNELRQVTVSHKLASLPPHGEDPFSESEELAVAEIESDAAVTLANIEDIERRVLDGLRGKANVQARIVNSGRESMGSPMRKFLEKYPEEARDFEASADFSGDFVRTHQRLVNEALPSHEERFREFLNQNLIQHVGGLDAALAEEVKSHHQRIKQVNSALSKLEYSRGTHVQVHDPDTRDVMIRDFRGQIRSILGAGMNLEGEYERLVLFQKMQELVARFRSDPEWTKRVADSRNWIDFGIRELRTADARQVNYYDSSLGKSGGQKAKLAFNVLAAALHAQYGLAEDETRTDTFRLVVIDEIFARTDEPNSMRALQLFQSLGFQLVLAAPWDAKVRIAEAFVDSYHLAVNPNDNASSLLRATRAAYDEARERALKPTKSHGHSQ